MIRRSKRRAVRHSRLKHFFVPGLHNSFRPLFLQFETVLVTAAVIVLLFAVALGIEKLVIKNPAPQIGAVVASILVELANSDRSKEGFSGLRVSPLLEKAAQMKADDMAARGYFAHNTPEGLEPWHWFGEAGYDFTHAGENLAVYFSDSAEVEKAWMDSPLHRANILSDRFTEIGIALAHGTYEGYETTFVVQMFGNPAGSEEARVVGPASIPEAEEPIAGASAEAQPIGAIKNNPPSSLWKVLSSPHTTLQYVYSGIAALILFALSLLFFVELRRLHIPSLLRGVSLIVLLVVLLYSTTFISGEVFIL